MQTESRLFQLNLGHAPMKRLIGVLYLLTGLVGFAWAWYVHAMVLYGAPFGWWNVALYGGSLTLIAGAVLWWASKRRWIRWLPVIGSGMLGSFFVPAFVVDLPNFLAVMRRDPQEVVIGVGSLGLVLSSLLVALRKALQARVR